jgi:hypothetical protein
MGEMENVSDMELLYRLRMEYLQALQLEDFNRIDTIITPQFWERFKGYYEEYKKSWKNPGLLHMVNPSHEKRMDLDWMDHVLRGELEIWL